MKFYTPMSASRTTLELAESCCLWISSSLWLSCWWPSVFSSPPSHFSSSVVSCWTWHEFCIKINCDFWLLEGNFWSLSHPWDWWNLVSDPSLSWNIYEFEPLPYLWNLLNEIIWLLPYPLGSTKWDFLLVLPLTHPQNDQVLKFPFCNKFNSFAVYESLWLGRLLQRMAL